MEYVEGGKRKIGMNIKLKLKYIIIYRCFKKYAIIFTSAF